MGPENSISGNVDDNIRLMTIVVPVRNRERLIGRCLDSLKAQTWRPLRVIVVDNGSTDSSGSVARHWAEVNSSLDFQVDVAFEPEAGACAARQLGLEMTHSDHIMFFDSDDTMRPGTVARAMNVFGSDPSVDIVVWPVVIHLLDGTLRKTKDPVPAGAGLMQSHLVHGVLRTQGYAVRTEYLRQAGGWNSGLPVWNDWELGVRLILSGPKVIAVNDIGADVFSQAESITGTGFLPKCGMWEKSLKAVADDIIRKNPAGRRKLLMTVAYRTSVLAACYEKEGGRFESDRLMDCLVSGLRRSGAGRLRIMLLKIVHRYTVAGGRGAYAFTGFML